MSAFPVRPTIPARPAAYVRDGDATIAGMTAYRDMVISMAEDLGWPVPTVYADVGPPASQLAALTEAITVGRHDGVFVTHPAQISHDLAELEAFDRLCRQHGVRLRFRWCQELTDTRALFELIRDARDFTVTDEHLRLLCHARITWDSTEFGAPQIDPKRPYGNSNVHGDIAEILEVPGSEWANEDLNPRLDTEWRFLRLHAETALALQIALVTGEFRTGRYIRGEEPDNGRWRREQT